jgi:hypothetical protein
MRPGGLSSSFLERSCIMTLVADMETMIEDTQFGDPVVMDAADDADTDGWCRCICFCKEITMRTSYGTEVMAGVDFGK